MGELSLFLKKNKIVKKNTFYPATKSLCDENGKPLEWEIRPLSTKENDEIKDRCTIDVQVTGKPNLYRPRLNTSKYIAEMVAASVVFPDLYDAELQDSYGVYSPDELIKEMIDSPTEYNDFASFIQNYNGMDEGLNEKVEEAKN